MWLVPCRTREASREESTMGSAPPESARNGDSCLDRGTHRPLGHAVALMIDQHDFKVAFSTALGP